MNPNRNLAFVLAATNHGSLIVNRMDFRMRTPTTGIGVGYQLLGTANYGGDEAAGMMMMLELCHHYHGDGVVAVDCGANIGAFTIQWAIAMVDWGTVIAIEAQERVFYALAGNIALNNCFNARAIHAAVGDHEGTLRIPTPDYLTPGCFGSLELRHMPVTEFIGQEIDYSNLTAIRMMTLDALALSRLDLLKIDVERMELEVLAGAKETIEQFKPVIIVECVKTPPSEITRVLAEHGYAWFPFGQNFLAVHPSDPISKHVTAATGSTDVCG